MKRELIICFFVSLLLFTLLNASFYTIYADSINLNITDDSFSKEFNPSEKPSGTTNALANPFINTIIQIINPILGLLQVIGAVFSVVAIALFGFNMILSSTGLSLSLFKLADDAPDTRAHLMNYLRYFMIGSVLLFASVTIVKTVFNLIFV